MRGQECTATNSVVVIIDSLVHYIEYICVFDIWWFIHLKYHSQSNVGRLAELHRTNSLKLCAMYKYSECVGFVKFTIQFRFIWFENGTVWHGNYYYYYVRTPHTIRPISMGAMMEVVDTRYIILHNNKIITKIFMLFVQSISCVYASMQRKIFSFLAKSFHRNGTETNWVNHISNGRQWIWVHSLNIIGLLCCILSSSSSQSCCMSGERKRCWKKKNEFSCEFFMFRKSVNHDDNK